VEWLEEGTRELEVMGLNPGSREARVFRDGPQIKKKLLSFSSDL